MEQQEDNLYCPKCGSSHLTANKKGYGVGKAAAGVILTGGVGLLAGFIGSGKVKITCLKCGHVSKPGELRTTPLSNRRIVRQVNNFQEEFKSLKTIPDVPKISSSETSTPEPLNNKSTQKAIVFMLALFAFTMSIAIIKTCNKSKEPNDIYKTKANHPDNNKYTKPDGSGTQKYYNGSQEQKKDLDAIDEYMKKHPDF